MKLNTNVGQIFLSHPKDENFSSLYEEAFSKNGQTVELFMVMEITGAGFVKNHRAEFEQLAQQLVMAFKKTYITSAGIDGATFEKALTSINGSLSRLLGRGKVNWYGKFNAAVGAVYGNELSISVTGNALVYLVRKGEFNLLSEGLAEDAKPVKIFSNFSSGRVLNGDRVILSTKQLFNYLAMPRIEASLAEDTLEETCQEIIDALNVIKNIGFATFVFEITAAESAVGVISKRPDKFSAVQNDQGETSLRSQTAAAASARALRQITKTDNPFVRYLLKTFRIIWEILWQAISGLYRIVFNFFRNRPKKYLFAAIAIVIVLLLANIGYAAWKKQSQQKQATVTSGLNDIANTLSEAEAALIYGDQNRATTLLAQADTALKNASSSAKASSQYRDLENKLNDLKNKVNKGVTINNPTVLTQFPNLPNHLIHSPNGFLGFNSDAKTVTFYDFRVGQTQTILKTTNTANLVASGYAGGAQGFVFLQSNGIISRLDVKADQLNQTASTTPVVDPNLTRITAMSVVGDGSAAKLYLLDQKQNQIWRSKLAANAFQPSDAWLAKTTTADFSKVMDMTVDNNIYLLYPDRIDKYFNGQKQNFTLDPVVPALKNPKRIFVSTDTQSLYILDPANNRILIFTKQGKFTKQIISPKFNNLQDMFADEKNKILYALSGSELLQIGL